MKICCICKNSKPLSEFHKNGKYRDGVQYRCISCTSIYNQNLHATMRSLAIEKLGGDCVRCGFSDPRALQIDHINGGGNIERKAGLSSRTVMKRVISGDTDDFQLLCANCNWIKKSEMNETCLGTRKR